MLEYAALVAPPRALPDGLILVFQHPVKQLRFTPENPQEFVATASEILQLKCELSRHP